LRHLKNLSEADGTESSVFVNGGLSIDYAAGVATLDGQELHLTPIEFRLLCLLAHNVDKVLTHQYILREVWGSSQESYLASLRVFMGTLRKKIEADPSHPRYIQTHIGIGYRMIRIQ
jgi:two-component system KDP operon response regulator KdpE